MGGYGRDICAAAMMSGVSKVKGLANYCIYVKDARVTRSCLPADEYAPDALGVLYGLGWAE